MSGILLVPTGSCEQHGPHLPFDTDTRIATAVATAGGELVAPALAYGSSGEHEEFDGTVSIGHEALRTMLIEFGRSACRWADKVVFVNAHGGNVPALVSAIRLLRYEHRETAWFACAPPEGDAHAGHTETSLMLAIAPETVDMAKAAPGNTTPLEDLMPALRSGKLREISPNGVLGDPTGATPEHGHELLNTLVSGLRTAIERWQPDSHGRLR
ncbi:mycofactocin biosynthesis peptidyl-dipeptidase MftE [Amycolatopsis sp. cg5]|uniref:mycofactocin biosynthesis peptidyl-dipeptidase MftE n=1 Tax=Amycolatopsis sp. cg5 TaxID=3238802 RepID=UPI0035233E6B